MAKRLKIPTLLVISENPSVRFWVKKHLSEQYFVIDAQRRGEAILTIRSSPLDFIILDSEFQDFDPIELAKEIRQELKEGITPILLVTGRLKKTYLKQAADAGVSDFLSSQLDGGELKMKIESGKKAAASRDKTAELSTSIQAPKQKAASSLKNKSVIPDSALRLLAAAKIEQLSVILLLIRIDRFQELPLSETHLQELSDLIQDHLRPSDLLIPSTEGQFIALLPDLAIKEAEQIAEKLRSSVQRNRFESEKGPFHLTISIALSPLESSETFFTRMIDSAVKALKSAQNTTISLKEPL